MTRQRLRRDDAANDTHKPGCARSDRLQIELEASVLEALLREKYVRADHLRPCNPRSADVIRELLLGCLTMPDPRSR